VSCSLRGGVGRPAPRNKLSTPAVRLGRYPGQQAAPRRPRRRRTGRIFTILGALALVAALGLGGYYVWLFWGTGISTSHAQHRLRQEIVRRIEQPRIPSTPKSTKGIPAVTLADGEAMAIIRIPKIHLNMVVVQGTSTDDLKKGPGHYPETPYPWADRGKVAIAGHRTTYLHPFWSLDTLRPGDLIELVTEFGTFRYHVTDVAVVLPTDTWIVRQTRQPTLILTTCTPRFSASHRLVVFASR
jgi:sortase A